MNTYSIPPFQLLWTLGFSGKRFLDPCHEAKIGAALSHAVNDLVEKAMINNARLTAVSSLARGGDVLFAESLRTLSTTSGSIPWKCLLPFTWEDFIRIDLANDLKGCPLAEAEQAKLKCQAERCLTHSRIAPEITSHVTDASDKEQQEAAYLECGYRTVDESDIMIILLRNDEVGKLLAGQPTERKAGTFAIARYAIATGRPVILLDADAEDIWTTRHVLNVPISKNGTEEWFVDPAVTGILEQAVSTGTDTGAILHEITDGLSGPLDSARASVALIEAQLSELANRHQGRIQDGLRWVLRFHLAASTLAAIAATMLVIDHPESTPKVFLGMLAALTLLEPSLAFAAWWLERNLHHDGTREVWLTARVLAELCRSAVAKWPLPIQPRDTQCEENFLTGKRLVRTLRLLREQDIAAAMQGTPRNPHETQLEADMRAACETYRSERLRNQSKYYNGKYGQARLEESRWRRYFQAATWFAIVAGLFLATDHLLLALGSHLLNSFFEHILKAIIIIAPFLAAHCLGTMTILDTRRRCRRYAEIETYLDRLANTLEQTEANPSRIRLIEHAERTLIEEQHEWFSVMSNLNV